jgi:DNA-binding transcriptional ArsR family regulator
MATKTRIDDLELVVAHSEQRTFSQVAKRVGMTQPTISKRLEVVQRRLHLRLFETNHTGADCSLTRRAGLPGECPHRAPRFNLAERDLQFDD